ncbi:odorant receptor 131-2-like [Myripristis murdjan]|uniref:odorant receptor 131-2-like n=1 Tax=Myripristis murdjan TaxID=586833 RepID=UPI001175DD65|nr:odorant receptor 131-2-like [Myripristis murdjan]
MNFSSISNVTAVVRKPESFHTAVTKIVVTVALFISINYINGTLVHTFNRHQILHMNPRYILFIHLVVNDMIQLTAAVTLFVFSYVFYTINVSLCCLLLISAVLTTKNTPMNLASMAAECYIAICLPLQHSKLCTAKRIYVTIGLMWLISAISVLPDLFVLLATEPLEYFYSRIVCLRPTLFQNTALHEKNNLSNIVLLVIVWVFLVYTYLRILFAAKAADGDAKKARNTILLHGFQLLLCMLTYIDPLLKQALLYWFPEHYVNSLFVCYIIIQILPRLISPIVYGIRDQTFRRYLKRYLLCSVTANTTDYIERHT